MNRWQNEYRKWNRKNNIKIRRYIILRGLVKENTITFGSFGASRNRKRTTKVSREKKTLRNWVENRKEKILSKPRHCWKQKTEIINERYTRHLYERHFFLQNCWFFCWFRFHFCWPVSVSNFLHALFTCENMLRPFV